MKSQKLSPEEEARIHEWGNSPRQQYESKSVRELFEEQVSSTPEKIALRFLKETITYAKLNSHANRVAHYLRKFGAGPEVVVGVEMGRSIEAIICILGILKTGAAYAIMNPEYPISRLKEMVRDASIGLILSNSRSAGNTIYGEAHIINYKQLPDNCEGIANIASNISLDNAAYVSFTSGSTGKPKGVIGIHRSISHLIGLSRFHYNEKLEQEVCCLNAPLSFGSTVAMLFMPLCCGFLLVVIPDGDEKDPRKFARAVQENQITSLTMVPSLISQLCSLGDVARAMLKSVRKVALAGAAVTQDLMDKVRSLMPQAQIVIGYAASEIGAVAVAGPEGGDWKESILLGRPAHDTQIYILDHDMNLVPIGVPGELCVASSHLARGYIGRPELTAERFVPNPFGCSAGERLYRTGDLVKFRSDGQVEYLGRLDTEVKVRGFRVELTEIESALARYEAIEEAVVIGDGRESSQRLVAYVVRKREKEANVTAIRKYLQERLPDYMVPSLFVFLDSLPLNPHGKVDREALPLRGADRPVVDGQYEGPRDFVEAAVTHIWETALGFEQIGIHDDFLDIGGDSLIAALIASEIRERFAVEIPLPLFFENLTIADLATEISRSQDGSPA